MSDELFLEKLKIVQQLAELKNSVEKLSWSIKNIEEMKISHHKTLYGTNGTPGLDKKVDRLEQAEAGREKNLKFVWGGIASIVVALIISWIKGGLAG